MPADERKPVAPGDVPAKGGPQAREPNDARVEQVDRSEEPPEKRPEKREDTNSDRLRLGILLHEDTGRFVYRGINSTTQEVERQYPPEDVLRRLAYLRELSGKLIDQSF